MLVTSFVHHIVIETRQKRYVLAACCVARILRCSRSWRYITSRNMKLWNVYPDKEKDANPPNYQSSWKQPRPNLSCRSCHYSSFGVTPVISVSVMMSRDKFLMMRGDIRRECDVIKRRLSSRWSCRELHRFHWAEPELSTPHQKSGASLMCVWWWHAGGRHQCSEEFRPLHSEPAHSLPALGLDGGLWRQQLCAGRWQSTWNCNDSVKAHDAEDKPGDWLQWIVTTVSRLTTRRTSLAIDCNE